MKSFVNVPMVLMKHYYKRIEKRVKEAERNTRKKTRNNDNDEQ